MNRNQILEKLIYNETGRTIAGAPIWKEIERATGNGFDDGIQWITGQDDVLEKWEYYIDLKRTHDEECDQWSTDIHLLEIKIEDKQTHQTWNVQVDGATL